MGKACGQRAISAPQVTPIQPSDEVGRTEVLNKQDSKEFCLSRVLGQDNSLALPTDSDQRIRWVQRDLIKCYIIQEIYPLPKINT